MIDGMPTEITTDGLLKSVSNWLFGSWAGWATGAATIVGILKLFGIDKKLGFDIGAMFEQVKDFFSGLIDKLMGKAEEAIDPESVTMKKAIADRINEDRSFAAAERAIGIPGIGKELRDIALKASKEGGDPTAVGRKIHQDSVDRIIAKWQDANPEDTPPESLLELAEKAATGIAGIKDQDNQPRVVRKGVVGLLMQAQEAKDKESTLTEGEVKAITLSPELEALVQAAAAPAREAANENPAPAAPPAPARKPAVPAAGK